MSGPVSSRSFRSSDGVRLNVLEAGADCSGGVIAFIPGWSMPASLWRFQLGFLGERFRVAALDPRGQGESEVCAGGYEIDRRADDIAEFLAHYRPGVLVGWSLGALEALQCVYRHGSEILKALVVVDSSVGEPPVPATNVDFREALARDRGATMEQFVRALFKTTRPEPEIAGLCEVALRMPLAASLALFPSHVPREHWRDLVEGFTKPLLYVATPQFAGQAQNLGRRRPSTRIEIFRDAGHALFVDEPERFGRLLAKFATPVLS